MLACEVQALPHVAGRFCQIARHTRADMVIDAARIGAALPAEQFQDFDLVLGGGALCFNPPADFAPERTTPCDIGEAGAGVGQPRDHPRQSRRQLRLRQHSAQSGKGYGADRMVRPDHISGHTQRNTTRVLHNCTDRLRQARLNSERVCHCFKQSLRAAFDRGDTPRHRYDRSPVSAPN